MALNNPVMQTWKLKDQIVQDYNPPVINVLNNVADLKGGIRPLKLLILQSNTETDSKDIDVVVTIDDQSYTLEDAGLADSTFYAYVLSIDAEEPLGWKIIQKNGQEAFGFQDVFGELDDCVTERLQCHSLQIGVKLKSAAGTAQRLYVWLTYQQMEAV